MATTYDSSESLREHVRERYAAAALPPSARAPSRALRALGRAEQLLWRADGAGCCGDTTTEVGRLRC